MPGEWFSTPSSRAKLRSVVRRLSAPAGRLIPDQDLLALAAAVRPGSAMTIDAAATCEIGAPVVIVHLPARAPRQLSLRGLTPREHEVAALVARGWRNQEIAAQLGISLATVKDHVHRVLARTGLRSRAGLAAAFALEATRLESGTAIHPKMGTPSTEGRELE